MTAPHRPRYKGSRDIIQPGDKVAIMGDVYRQGKIVGEAPMLKGEVLRLYRHGEKGQWRANIAWEGSPTRAFIHTGKGNWEYVRNLTLIERGTVAKL